MVLTLAGVMALGASTATASNANFGAVNSVIAFPQGIVLFNTNGVRTPRPACQSPSVPTRWAIDATSPKGQAVVTALFFAKQNGKAVYVNGSGVCDVLADTETVGYLVIAD